MEKIALESWNDCREDLIKLIHQHWEEIAWYKDKMALSPDWEKYDKIDELEMLKIITLRLDGELIGYSIYFLVPSLHYTPHLFAQNDILYIKPEYRSQNLGTELLKYSEICMQAEGASMIDVKMKSDHAFHGLAEYCQYSLMEYNYTKWIGG